MTDLCKYCGGQMIESFPSESYKTESARLRDPLYEVKCFQCGRTREQAAAVGNKRAETKIINSEADQPEMTMTDDGEWKARRKKRYTRPNRKAGEIKDDYRRFLGVITQRREPFLARDIAAELNTTPDFVSAWLRKAESEKYARRVGKVSVFGETWNQHCYLMQWEAVKSAPRSQVS